MTGLIPSGEFNALARPFKYSCFRLEVLQSYAGSGEDEWIAAFERGDPEPPPSPAHDEWAAALRAQRATGRLLQRVHVAVEPLSAYMQFEVSWAYALNDAAGEDVRIVPVQGEQWPAGVPRFDFWLFDSVERFDPVYERDGTWRGVQPEPDARMVVAANSYRDAALHHAVDWWAYVKARPALLKRIPPRFVPIEIL